MAFSKSFETGQIALSCELCEETSKIKWKCLTCNSYMCSRCCKIHKKFKSSDKHDIVDIRDIAEHSAQSGTTLDFTNINCRGHNDQKCCLYCKECEEVVCLMCITKVHNTHKMVDISAGYQMSLNKIKHMKSEVEEDILKLTSDVSKLDAIKSAERSHFIEEKEKILSHEKAVKEAVEQHSKKLLTELDQRWKSFENSIMDEETYAIQMAEDLETDNKAFIQVMNSNDVFEVFKTASESKAKRESRKPVSTTYQRLPRLIQGEINLSSVESIHGTLEDMKQKVEIEVKEEYTTTFGSVSSLVCCDDGSLWISDGNNKTIQNVKLSHGSVHINNTINLKAYDMVLTKSEDLLLSVCYTNRLNIAHTTGEVRESKFSIAPLITTAVHVSKDNKILVGAKDNGPVFPASGPRQVIVMDMEGRHEQVHHYDNKKKSLFTYPYKITTDKDNNIYVVDMLSNIFNGRVVVLGQGVGVRGIYTGHPDVIDTKHMFTPTDIVTTQSDNVIVADTYNDTLHILNNNVQCVKYLNTKYSGIELPCSLYIDIMGFLYIGCVSGNGKSDAKIHVVQLVNFGQ